MTLDNVALEETPVKRRVRFVPHRVGLAELGISVATGWRRSKDDPDFPKLIQLGPQMRCFVEDELERYKQILIERREQRLADADAA
jgi:predicted DNA-binding transcriptional regulator AlpA